MRVGIRFALTTLVLASIAVTAAIVHLLWWRTAQGNSRLLAETINRQIVAQVEDEISQIAAQGRSAFWSIRTLFFQNVLQTREADKREFVFLSQLQAQPSVSWIVFGWPDGDVFAAHKLGDERLEMMEIAMMGGTLTRRVDVYKVLPGDIEFVDRRFELTSFRSTAQPWYSATIDRDGPHWIEVEVHPTGRRPALAFAGPIDLYTSRQGVLAVMIEHDRLSRFLAGLAVGRSGSAFILRADGSPVAVPDPEADELMGTRLDRDPLLPLARRAIAEAAAGVAPGAGRDLRLLDDDGDAYNVRLSPLAFADWTLAVVIPEKEFLGEIEATTARLAAGILALVVAAAALSAWLGRRLIARPLAIVAGEIAHVERFELERVAYHPSRLAELDELSGTIHRMAGGLSAFRLYLPDEVVRMLLAEGIEAKPGGVRRELTVMFADVAGFTGLSERLGERVVPLLGRYLDLATTAVQAERGTVDKYIGDAVMAFWGAPREDRNHAVHACRAALAAVRAVSASGLRDDGGRPLGIRIGLNSGEVLVGNVGSRSRLNYTVIGDAVNVASRLESANKLYGTAILIGARTRELAGAAILTRLVDKIAVYGRGGGMKIHELIGLAGETMPSWVEPYEEGYACYSWGDFATAIRFFEETILLRGEDAPSRLMIRRCRAYLEDPPKGDWDGVSVMAEK